jgi:hypothetical protein
MCACHYTTRDWVNLVAWTLFYAVVIRRCTSASYYRALRIYNITKDIDYLAHTCDVSYASRELLSHIVIPTTTLAALGYFSLLLCFCLLLLSTNNNLYTF